MTAYPITIELSESECAMIRKLISGEENELAKALFDGVISEEYKEHNSKKLGALMKRLQAAEGLPR
ncbi:hypothetical protein ACFQS3_02545 [Glycomyces mayteni]|uniref:Uncharacterized protein n=1 Tax=Glycomyces mayteni TaxID=543887 RepID=A0ABW2D1A5_9ACTN|nr:hypothetical protein GCM10025732_48070 [Glycomyces mayteni]